MEPVIIFICVFAAVGISTVIPASVHDLLLIRKKSMSGINFSSIFLGIQVGFGLAYLGDKIIEAARIIADKPRMS
jgi:hypothetical protein